MTRTEKLNLISNQLCGVSEIDNCTYMHDGKCKKFGKCGIVEKTDEQLNYIVSPKTENCYLEACAGSGKTEVLAMKAAYEICKWNYDNAGVAVLSFTNEATSTIRDRIFKFYPHHLPSRHFVGTLSSFLFGYIAQKFGYKLFRKNCRDKDKAFTLVDVDSSIYSNFWLENYKLDFPTPKEKPKIYANQIVFRCSDSMWYIKTGDEFIDLKHFYDLPDEQELLIKIRSNKKNDKLFSYEYLKQKVNECKLKFWEAGFANFEDMNSISIHCLQNKQIREILAQKFPIIMVDECQDLSVSELRVLHYLQVAGTKIHLVGDLNQAIYSFKDAKPEFLNKHIKDNNYSIYSLTNNFRSTQKIVDVASFLQNIALKINGKTESLIGGDDVKYIEYDNEKEAIEKYEHMLNSLNIPISSSIILVRNNSLKNKLTKNAANDYYKHAIIYAIQLWQSDKPNNIKIALKLLGWQIQKLFGTQGRADAYYCPNIYQNTFQWRLVLRNIIEELVNVKSLCQFDSRTYSEWYHGAKDKVCAIIFKHLENIVSFDHEKIEKLFRTPNGTAKDSILLIDNGHETKIKIDTIHATKGGSYDAVMVISTRDARGQGGYWENWIDDGDEITRYGYVACTRPKYLLCWAVPKLNSLQKVRLEGLGFTKT